jgi:uncharacterized SAM-binding protein YcdF (DUF218 family)
MGRLLSLAVRLAGAPLRLADRPAPADAIVVLGAPLAAGGRLSPIGRERIDAGVALWRAGLAPVVCVTGGDRAVPPGPRREADAMAERAVELGLPPAALAIEREARTTADNARLCRALLPAARTVWLVTQPFHGRRARWHFRRAGFTAHVWPIADSLELRRPGSGARWIAREYGAWIATLVRR